MAEQDHKQDLILNKIYESKPIPCDNKDQVELHVLTGKGHLVYALWAIKSFLWLSERRMPIIIHSDGSIHQDEANTLQKHFPECQIIDRPRARKEIAELIKTDYPSLAHYRCVFERILFYKLVDFYHYSSSKRVFGMDSDILWLKKPTQVNELLDKKQGFYMDDIQNAYGFNIDALRKYYGIRLLPRINTGIISIPGPHAYNLAFLDYAASLGLKHDKDKKIGRGGWFEQTLFATMFSVEQEYYERLDRTQYFIPRQESTGNEDATAVHCVTPRRKLFHVFAEKALERQVFAGLF